MSPLNNCCSLLYRKRRWLALPALAALITGICFVLPAQAQKKKEKGPRAIAVVAWTEDTATPPQYLSVLTPIAILVDGTWYNANLYMAQPAPMAVDPGVIYDVQKTGESIGAFTISSAREKDASWYGAGIFEALGAVGAQTKIGVPGQGSSASAAPAQKPAADEDDDRPHLHRGAAPPTTPKLKHEQDTELQKIDSDPNRPRLRRGVPEDLQKERETTAQNANPAAVFKAPETHMLAAVSDESGAEPRSFAFHSRPGEVSMIQAKMEKLARAALDKLRKMPDPTREKMGKRERFHGSSKWPPLDLQDGETRIFDVNSNNAPIVIYTGDAMVNGVKKYVTIGAWEEIDESMRQVFTQVTDDQHLDIYPRLEIIDAVDAFGNGRGQLLFRATGDQGSRFILYHPGPDSIDVIYDEAQGESGG